MSFFIFHFKLIYILFLLVFLFLNLIFLLLSYKNYPLAKVFLCKNDPSHKNLPAKVPVPAYLTFRAKIYLCILYPFFIIRNKKLISKNISIRCSITLEINSFIWKQKVFAYKFLPYFYLSNFIFDLCCLSYFNFLYLKLYNRIFILDV